jgi:Type VI secretion system (T6SS), amidase effector protein 4
MDRLPSFDSLWHNYPLGEAATVKSQIGGHVNATWIDNTCVIRLCHALNYSGFRVHPDAGLHTISGKDGYQYGYRVSEFKPYLEHHFGPPTSVGGQRGIIWFDLPGHAGWTGHFDLWDGMQCRYEDFSSGAASRKLWPCT